MNRKRKPPLDPKIKDHARDNRQDSSFPARLLWGRLRRRQVGGLRFRREHPVGPYVVDFVCLDVSLVVEVDGLSHVGQAEADAIRTRFLNDRGLRVIRVMNDDVLGDLDGVVEQIARAVGVDGGS